MQKEGDEDAVAKMAQDALKLKLKGKSKQARMGADGDGQQAPHGKHVAMEVAKAPRPQTAARPGTAVRPKSAAPARPGTAFRRSHNGEEDEEEELIDVGTLDLNNRRPTDMDGDDDMGGPSRQGMQAQAGEGKEKESGGGGGIAGRLGKLIPIGKKAVQIQEGDAMDKLAADARAAAARTKKKEGGSKKSVTMVVSNRPGTAVAKPRVQIQEGEGAGSEQQSAGLSQESSAAAVGEPRARAKPKNPPSKVKLSSNQVAPEPQPLSRAWGGEGGGGSGMESGAVSASESQQQQHQVAFFGAPAAEPSSASAMSGRALSAYEHEEDEDEAAVVEVAGQRPVSRGGPVAEGTHRGVRAVPEIEAASDSETAAAAVVPRPLRGNVKRVGPRPLGEGQEFEISADGGVGHTPLQPFDAHGSSHDERGHGSTHPSAEAYDDMEEEEEDASSVMSDGDAPWVPPDDDDLRHGGAQGAQADAPPFNLPLPASGLGPASLWWFGQVLPRLRQQAVGTAGEGEDAEEDVETPSGSGGVGQVEGPGEVCIPIGTWRQRQRARHQTSEDGSGDGDEEEGNGGAGAASGLQPGGPGPVAEGKDGGLNGWMASAKEPEHRLLTGALLPSGGSSPLGKLPPLPGLKPNAVSVQPSRAALEQELDALFGKPVASRQGSVDMSVQPQLPHVPQATGPLSGGSKGTQVRVFVGQIISHCSDS